MIAVDQLDQQQLTQQNQGQPLDLAPEQDNQELTNAKESETKQKKFSEKAAEDPTLLYKRLWRIQKQSEETQEEFQQLTNTFFQFEEVFKELSRLASAFKNNPEDFRKMTSDYFSALSSGGFKPTGGKKRRKLNAKSSPDEIASAVDEIAGALSALTPEQILQVQERFSSDAKTVLSRLTAG